MLKQKEGKRDKHNLNLTPKIQYPELRKAGLATMEEAINQLQDLSIIITDILPQGFIIEAFQI